MGNQLQVRDRKTGEMLEVATAPTETLAAFILNAKEVHEEIRDAEAIVNEELIARMDRDASWTARVNDGRTEYELSTTSPDAGTTAYVPEDLERELRPLVERGTVSADAAGAALKRQVVMTLDIPLNLPLAETAAGLAAIEVALGDNKLPVVSADPRTSSNMRGVNALRKVPGTTAALDRAKSHTAPPARRAKVSIKAQLTR